MFKCNLCLKEFSTKPRLNRHIVNKVCTQCLTYTCTDCNTVYDKYRSYWMHINRGCIMKNSNKIVDKKYDTLAKELEDVKSENRKLVEMVKDIKNNIDKAKVINNVGNINGDNINGDNIVNNNTLNDNSVTNNNVIMLKKFGDEDINKLSNAEIYQVLKEGAYATNKLVELLHFNKKLPENHNILFKNVNTRYGETFNGDKWMSDYKTNIINTLFDSKKLLIDGIDKKSIPYKKLTNVTKKAIELIINSENDSELAKNVKDDLKMLIYNNRDMILNKKNNNNLALKN